VSQLRVKAGIRVDPRKAVYDDSTGIDDEDGLHCIEGPQSSSPVDILRYKIGDHSVISISCD